MTARTPATVLDTDDYFLSATNPIACTDQRALEALAIELVSMPTVQAEQARRC